MSKIHLFIENKKVNIEFKKHLINLVRINRSIQKGCFKNFQKMGGTYIDTPAIVGITGACENVDTLFKVYNRLSLPLFFTQTAQLYLEQALQIFPDVYTVIHSGRDEEIEDERHLKEFQLIEEEFDCTQANMKRRNYNEDKMYETLLFHIESTIKSAIKTILREQGPLLQKVYKRDTNKLREAIKKPFFRITYEKAIQILKENGYPKIRFGDDLKAKHESLVTRHLNSTGSEIPVFIMKYPKEIKFFNMKVWTKDPRLVLSADLIFPYAGEGVGAAVREHNFRKLKKRLITSPLYKLHLKHGGEYSDFEWYLKIIKDKKTNPHGGYGIGNERVVQYILGEKNIRNASVFSALNKQTGDWNKKRYGKQRFFVRSHRNH